MTDQAADKRSWIIAGALIVTLLFLGVFGWLLVSTATTTGCPPGPWFLERLRCLSPNELGDTFAGAFAPVAFVWLVAAVMLQRNELAAQRQELRESRAVATEQVEEARKNVAFIEAQTIILEANKDLELRRHADDQFEEMLDLFNRSFIESKTFHLWLDSSSPGEKETSLKNFRISPKKGDDLYEITKNNLAELSNLNFAIEIFGSEESRFKYYNLDKIESFSEILDVIDSSIPILSLAMAARAVYINLSSTSKDVHHIIKVLKEHGTRAEWRELPDRHGKFTVRTLGDDEIPF